MKKLGLVLMTLLLLAGCSRNTEATMEYVHDTLPLQAQYTIAFDVPAGAVGEELAGGGVVYSDPDGNYSITAETLEAASLEEAVQTISGFPYEQLDVIALQGETLGEYHFAWSSVSDEGETVSRCQLCAGDGCYYAVTMTRRADAGTACAPVTEAVFSSITLAREQIV